ncbi:MAG TPA: DUF2007 domain-containing protein [Roseiflexaceae bacterium]|jgi:hypothetical protein|nr:DUF2007 domain-containing protein [Roseiflexaceae bacterium]
MTDTPWFWQRGDTRNQAGDTSHANVTTGGGDGDGVAPVCVGSVDGPLRAEIARSYMEDAGLTVFLQGEAVAGVYGMVSGPLSTVRVFVPASQAEEGARVFAELDFESTGDLLPDDE